MSSIEEKNMDGKIRGKAMDGAEILNPMKPQIPAWLQIYFKEYWKFMQVYFGWTISWNFWSLSYYNLMEIPFYKQQAWAGRVCLLGGVNHAQHRTNKPLSIDDCYQGDVVPITRQCVMWTHFMLGVRSVVKGIFNMIIVTLYWVVWPNR